MPGAVVLLSGRSFSGKSTIARLLSSSLAAVSVSYDAINEERGLHGGRGVAVEDWSHTNDIAHERVEPLLALDTIVVVDDTSSPRFLRDAWRDHAARSGARFLLVFVDVDLETVRRRLQANRSDLSRHDVFDRVMEEHL